MFNFFTAKQNAQSQENAIKIKVWSAWHEKDLLATNLFIYYGCTATYLFGGSSNIKREFRAPALLHFLAIQDAKTANQKKYDFWGIEEDPKHSWVGISRFKMGFGGEVKKYFGTWDKIFMPAWYNVYIALRLLNRRIRK